MKFNKVLILLVIILNIFYSTGCAEEIKSLSFYNLMDKENIITMIQWNINYNKILCIVTKHEKKIEESAIPFERLSFYKIMEKNNLSKIYEMEEMGFMGIYSLYDGNLMSIWAGGSAYHVKFFSTKDNEIKDILEEGVKAMPEIADIDNDGIPEILLSSGSLFNKDKISPKITKIYKWNGTSYSLIKLCLGNLGLK